MAEARSAKRCVAVVPGELCKGDADDRDLELRVGRTEKLHHNFNNISVRSFMPSGGFLLAVLNGHKRLTEKEVGDFNRL